MTAFVYLMPKDAEKKGAVRVRYVRLLTLWRFEIALTWVTR